MRYRTIKCIYINIVKYRRKVKLLGNDKYLAIDRVGSKFWFLNDQPHREDGPALEIIDSHKIWVLNGNLHREDGPAVEWSNGDRDWWINGKKLTEKEFRLKRF